MTTSVASERRAPRIVAFGGGTGMAVLLAGLKDYTDQVTAVVTVTDNGGSSGRLRNGFDMVAPGDIRNCLAALADVDPLVTQLLQYRFDESEFKGHCFGNLLIMAMTRIMGDFGSSVRELNRLLRVRGRVIPATDARVSLVAHHPDGTKSTGEVQITRSPNQIERVELRPHPVPLSTEIREAVETADLFLFGPGSLYTSVIPNLLLDGLMEAVNRTGRPRVYIGNIMTQPGETLKYKLSDHLRALRLHVGDDFPDAVIAHEGEVPAEILEKYAQHGSEPVGNDLAGVGEFANVRVVTGNFLGRGDGGRAPLKPGTARHDSAALARVIVELFLSDPDRPLGAIEAATGRRAGTLVSGSPDAGGRDR